MTQTMAMESGLPANVSIKKKSYHHHDGQSSSNVFRPGWLFDHPPPATRCGDKLCEREKSETRARYSKFSKAGNEESRHTNKISPCTWPSKLAMLVIYTPALIASTVLLVLGGSKHDIYSEFSLPKGG